MRDVTTILSDAEIVRLRALIAQAPALPLDASGRLEYPKILYRRDYIGFARLAAATTDPLVRKEALEKLRHTYLAVHDIETEEDYLADLFEDQTQQWFTDPNDIITLAVEQGGLGERDPRIPTGREGRRAAAQNKADREYELRQLRRRFTELTGRKLEEEPTTLASADGWTAAPAPDDPIDVDGPETPAPALVAAPGSKAPGKPAPATKRASPVTARERVLQAAQQSLR